MNLNQSNPNRNNTKQSFLFNESQNVDRQLMFPQHDGNRQKNPNFIDYLRILQRRKWNIIFCIIITILGSIIKIFLSTPIYEAEAIINYKKSNEIQFSSDRSQSYNNNRELSLIKEQLESRTMAEEIADNLPDKIIQMFTFPDSISSNLSKKKFIAQQLLLNLDVSVVFRSNNKRIYVTTTDSKDAKIIANSYVECIINWSFRKKHEQLTNTLDFVENQIDSFKIKLYTADSTLQFFKENNLKASLNNASSEILTRLIEAEATLNQTKTEREELEKRKEYIDKKKQELVLGINVVYSPKANQLKQKLLDAEGRYSSLKLHNQSNNQKEALILEQEISKLREELFKELINSTQGGNLIDPLSLQESISFEVDLEIYRVRERKMKENINNYLSQLKSIPSKELELSRLIREKEVNDKIYSMLLEKREEARIKMASEIGDIHILDIAEEPDFPVAPNKKKILIVGIMLGFILGVGFIFVVEVFDKPLRTEADVEKYLNLPTKALIPKIESYDKSYFKKRNKVSNDNYTILSTQYSKFQHIYDAYHTFQINFNLTNKENSIKSILITSASQNEGKTLTACNIAQFFAKAGKKTLLIDCDLRRPVVHKIFNIDHKPGLTDALVDKSLIIHEVDNISLFVLTCGTKPPNPSEILNTQKMKDIFEDLKKDFDFIILDSPPILPVTDPIILAGSVDGIYLVIRSGMTKQNLAVLAKKEFEKSGFCFSGSILNDINMKDVYGYSKKYYHYYNDEENKKK